MALTLDNIRQLYNLQKASDKEVMEFAKANNLEVINLSGVENTANLNDLKGNTGGSVFGFNNQQGTQQKTPTSFTLQSNLTFGGSEKYDIAKNVRLSSTGSIFNGFGNTKTTGFDTTYNQNVSSNVLQAGFSNETKKTSLLDSFLSNSMFNFNASKKQDITFVDGNAEIDMSKVKTQEFIDGGKLRYTMEDGSIVEKQLSDETIQKIGAKAQYSKIEYVDGNAVYYDLNGNEVKDKTRKARFGENGYVKDGNSIDEDLVSVLGQDKIDKINAKKAKAEDNLTQINEYLAELTDEKIAQVAETDPEKAEQMKKDKVKYEKRKANVEQYMFKEKEALASDYIKKVYKECDGDPEKIKARISNLIKNSDMNTEAAQQMVHILGSFVERTKDMSKEEVAAFFESAMDASITGGADNVTAMADPVTRMKGKKGKAMLDGYTTAAHNTGNEKVVADALTENIENTIDAETGVVDIEQTTNIGRAVTQMAGDEGAIALGQRVKDIDSDDLKVATNTAIDEQTARTGNKEVMETSIDVATSIKDAEKQVLVNENAHKIYEEMGASDKTKQARAEIVGSRIGDYHEDAQLGVDETERKFDIEDAYNLAVSQAIQNVASKNQQEMVQRTINSGNENAMTNVANHAYELDPDNIEDVVKMLKEQGSEKTKQALEEAKTRYEEQAQRDKAIADAKKAETERAKAAQAEAEKAKAKAQEQQTKTQTQQTAKHTVAQGETRSVKTNSNLSNVGILKVVTTKEFKEKTIAEKKEVFKQFNLRERAQAIGEMVESSDAYSLKGMMYSSFKTEILKYLVQHADAQNNQKLKYVERFLSPTDKKLLEEMKNEQAKNNIIL